MNEHKDMLLDLAQKLVEMAKDDKRNIWLQSMESSVECSNPGLITRRFSVAFTESLRK